MSSPRPSDPVYDVIGLGFGPANVAIGGAIIEKWASAATTVRALSPMAVPHAAGH